MNRLLTLILTLVMTPLALGAGLTNVGAVPVYTGTPVLVAAFASVISTSTYNGGFVIIETNFDATNDRLQMKSGYTMPSGVTAVYDAVTGVLTISGSEVTAEDMQEVLRQVEYGNADTNTAAISNRTITVVLGDKLAFSGNSHFYEYVSFISTLEAPSVGRSWTTAKTAAASSMNEYFGLTGYLATITTAEENAFIIGKVSGIAWLGASDAETEGTWKWVTGPEAGTVILTPYTGVEESDPYSNWNGTGEPNDSNNADYLHIMDWTTPAGRWNDLPDNGSVEGPYKATGYIIEWNGTPQETLTGVTTIQVLGPVVAISAPSYAGIDTDITGPVTFTLTYSNVSEGQISLVAANLTLIKTSTVGGTVSLTGSGLTRTVTVSGMSGEGNITLNLAAGSATNAAGTLSAKTAETFRRECFQVTAVNIDEFGVERETASAVDACVVFD